MGKQCWSQAESGSWGHSVVQTLAVVFFNLIMYNDAPGKKFFLFMIDSPCINKIIFD